jgi:hydroxyacylglutathione hydrolase
LATLEKELAKFAAARPTAVICQSGYRSSAASSILEKHGFTEIYNVVGGTLAWINAGFAVEGSGDGATCQSGTK